MKITILLLAFMMGPFQASNTPRDKALESLASAERNFSATSEAKGLRQAFVDNMAEDGLVFAPKPTSGKKLHASAPATTAYLSWYPAYADISSSLDWGTTGPYKLKPSAADEKNNGSRLLPIGVAQATGRVMECCD